MLCNNSECPGGAISWQKPTEDMEAIEVKCEGCGNTWLEPNKKYIDAQVRDLINEYYSKFED